MAIVIVFGLLFLAILGAAAACCMKKRKKASGQNGGYIMPTSFGSSQEAGKYLRFSAGIIILSR